MKPTAFFATVALLLVLICRTCLSEEQINVPNQEVLKTQETSSTTGPTAERDGGPVGVVSGESRGNGNVGVPAADPDSRQLPPGAFPPRIVVPGSPRPPPGQFPPGFPPLGAYDDAPPPPGAYPGSFPGQFPSRPRPGPPPPGGPYPPPPFPQRPFPGQRPPPPPPPFGDSLPSIFNPFPFAPLPQPSAIVNRAVASLAEFDDQRCVPRLLCELTSGSMPGVYSGGYRPYRPYRPVSQGETFVGQEQLLQLLAALTLGNPQGSPLSFFGGAALLGISSRGRPEHCYKAFPECPQDSDGLLHYLNNHNGGFFKAVGEPLRSALPGSLSPEGPVPRPPRPPLGPHPLGPQQPYPGGPRPPYPLGPQQPYPQGAQQPYPLGPQGQLTPRPLNYYAKTNGEGLVNSTDSEYPEVDNVLAASGDSEARIQVHPDRIVGLINSNQQLGLGDWRFPLENIGVDSSGGKKAIFPTVQNVLGTDVYRKRLRKGKKLGQFSSDPQVPVPSLLPHVQMLFPDRTGTGDLRLDNSELYGTKKRPVQSTSVDNAGTRYGRIYFPREVETVTSRPGEINTRYYVIFPGPAS